MPALMFAPASSFRTARGGWVDISFSKLLRPSASVEQIAFAAQASLVQREEAMRDSHWAVARSKRLIERMERLLAELR
jgi:hypothetical protein